MLKIWGRTNSVNVQKVLWCLAELGVPYERIDAGLAHGKNNEAWFLALNPNGTRAAAARRRLQPLGIELDRALSRARSTAWGRSAPRRSRRARTRSAGWIGSCRC